MSERTAPVFIVATANAIEQAIVAATYLAREQTDPLGTTHIQTEIEQTRPLSQVMSEKMEHLRAWAKTRTVAANQGISD